ncbi:SDR family NAD(P)-dependent oxidoreductase [Pseudonocardia acaciae]|uniref:SDR family NAD(P)-dependent oxidoreductase n=1 Tax=Pseudonocardia acaciae TaxID=551276 RepID=UPI00048E6070|nr:SDR family oxidoreductase [Pseudonocardia acaciae]
MSTARLTGKVAIVTGSGRGIGLAIAQRFAREGAKVVVADIREDNARAAAEGIESELGAGTAIAVGADVGLAADVDRMVTATTTAFGTVDVLVNNAADTSGQKHFFEADERWWDDILRSNLKSQYLCIDRVARIMAAQRSGSIINLSSGGATRSHRGMIAYDASKGGVEALTRSTALELAPYGVRVNTIVPGLIATGPDEPEWSLQRRDRTVPLGRGGTAEDLAGPAVFLASEDAAYVTGSKLVVDGGVLVQQRSPQVDTLRPEDYPDVPPGPR